MDIIASRNSLFKIELFLRKWKMLKRVRILQRSNFIKKIPILDCVLSAKSEWVQRGLTENGVAQTAGEGYRKTLGECCCCLCISTLTHNLNFIYRCAYASTCSHFNTGILTTCTSLFCCPLPTTVRARLAA